jgi:hypothetical protein
MLSSTRPSSIVLWVLYISITFSSCSYCFRGHTVWAFHATAYWASGHTNASTTVTARFYLGLFFCGGCGGVCLCHVCRPAHHFLGEIAYTILHALSCWGYGIIETHSNPNITVLCHWRDSISSHDASSHTTSASVSLSLTDTLPQDPNRFTPPHSFGPVAGVCPPTTP